MRKKTNKRNNYTRSMNKGGFVTNLGNNCDKKVNRFVYVFGLILLHIFIVFTLTSCGAKKKYLNITKDEHHEKKDYYLKQFDSLKQEIEYRNAIIQLSIEPVDPKRPNTAKFIRTETGFEYDGENSKVGAKSQKEEKEVRTESGGQKEESDKGEVKESKKEKNIEKEKEGNKSIGFIWGLVFLLFLVIFGKWKKWF